MKFSWLSLSIVVFMNIFGIPGAISAKSFVHHDIKLNYEPETRRLVVADTIETKGRLITAFRIAKWLNIEQVKIDGTPVKLTSAKGSWEIPRHKGGKVDRIYISLSGIVPTLNKRRDQRFWRGGVGDIDGTFLPGYSLWVPDVGVKRVTFRLSAEIKKNQIVVASGRLEQEAQEEELYRARFASDRPTELPSLFIGPYRVKERKIRGVVIRTYFHKDLSNFSDNYISQSAKFLKKFSSTIGEYPFQNFYIVSSPLPVGLGFPYLTYIGRMIVPMPFMQSRSLAHEIAHNWWGNGVFIDYGSGNWAEGITTYVADYNFAVEQGSYRAREMRLGWLRDYAALPKTKDHAVVDFKSRVHQAAQIIGYNKVAHIFYMLELELGPEIFKNGLRQFWKVNKQKIAGWSELQLAFEKVSTKKLDWFFRQWLNRVGAPTIKLGKGLIKKNKSGNALLVRISQSVPLYKLMVPIVVNTTEGLTRVFVRMSNTNASVEIPFRGKLKQVMVDPDFEIFRRLLPEEKPPILRDITLKPQFYRKILESDSKFRSAAIGVVDGLKERGTILVTRGEKSAANATIVVGKHSNIKDYSKQVLSIDVPEAAFSYSAFATAWQLDGKHPVLLVSAKDAVSLNRIRRALRHYGRYSFIYFDGRLAGDKGVWPTTASPLIINYER